MSFSPPLHGGDLTAASQQFGIAIDEWLDLSTGINPKAYPVGRIPEEIFHALPYPKRFNLEAVARNYYGCKNLLCVPGSQSAIELLPELRNRCRVAVPAVGYREHAWQWQKQGHELVSYADSEELDRVVDQVDVVVVINPNNPTAEQYPREQLLRWHQQLQSKAGWLIVDEAFADLYPAISLADVSHLAGLIVLKSVGKFFGLAGIRLGFVLANQAITAQLYDQLGLWVVNGPGRYLASTALGDQQWQLAAKASIVNSQKRMHRLISNYWPNSEITTAGLFLSLRFNDEVAQQYYQALASQGMLVRYWPPVDGSNCALLRVGLIGENDEANWQRFEKALALISQLLKKPS